MVVIDATGTRSLRPFAHERVDPKLCLFEFVYFARPDSRLYGQTVHQARQRMGEQLAEQAPVEADMVMGVPESGVPAAEGFARRSGIPFGQGLVKNRYIGRTLHRPEPGAAQPGRAHEAQPAQGEHRRQAARRRRRLDRARHDAAGHGAHAARGRGDRGPPADHVAARKVALLLRHRHRHRTELLAADLTVDEIRDYLGVDTLAYLEPRPARAAPPGASGAGFCTACFTGDYPVPSP